MTDKSINLAAAAAVLVALAVPALSGCGSRNAVAAGVAVGAPAEKLANTYRKRLPIDLDESTRLSMCSHQPITTALLSPS